jgi:hypothetical protein
MMLRRCEKESADVHMHDIETLITIMAIEVNSAYFRRQGRSPFKCSVLSLGRVICRNGLLEDTADGRYIILNYRYR